MARPPRRAKRNRRRGAIIAVAAIGIEAASLWLRAHRIGGRVFVRCRQGHVFTTLWIPGASVRSLRLGPWRVQRCPVGRHLSLVAPVDARRLTAEERRAAAASH